MSVTRTPNARHSARTSGARRDVTSTRKSEQEVESASTQLSLAMALCNLASGSALTCPWCGTNKPKKVKLVADKRYIKCFKCGEYRGAVKLVQEVLGVSFPVAVDLLNGKSPRANSTESDEHRAKRLAEQAERAEALAQSSFRAELACDIYNAVLASRYVSAEAAQRYYATWHISAEAVATVGFVAITDPKALCGELVGTFGQEAVVAAGLAREVDEGGRGDQFGLTWMFSKNYPIIEPQLSPRGRCHSMQFRPSREQKVKVDSHKAGRGAYVPPFMSLRGAGPDHLIGINLEYLCSLTPTRVDIVEGAKDVAADLTLGNAAFGMPGTGVLPPARSVQALERAGHHVRICMDGDSAGRESQQKVYEHFLANGFSKDRLSIHTMPEGLDVADILVSKFATDGCTCHTCETFRNKHS